MNIQVEWNKIVTNAISTLVAVVFVGAATIVWNGATSVDSKVQATRADMTHLIDSLSDQLAANQLQMTAITNQLDALIKGRKPTEFITTMPAPTVDVDGATQKTVPKANPRMMEQRMIQEDIRRQLKR